MHHKTRCKIFSFATEVIYIRKETEYKRETFMDLLGDYDPNVSSAEVPKKKEGAQSANTHCHVSHMARETRQVRYSSETTVLPHFLFFPWY